MKNKQNQAIPPGNDSAERLCANVSSYAAPLTPAERRAQTKEEKDKVRKRFHGVDQSLLDFIPADETPDFFSDAAEKRVCTYNRVSTDNIQQVSSIELQQFTNIQTIQENPNWKLVKEYTDEGVSGTSIEHRKSFQEMIADCEKGLIDVIIVKSVSRFARNLVDCVEVVRKLKDADPPVGVFFETEHIFSLDKNSDMFLEIMAMLAQSESQTKSDIMNDSIEKRFRNGIFLTPVLLGYDKDSDGNLVINEDEAKTVRLMYYMLLAGSTAKAIAETLTMLGRQTKLGNVKWSASGVIAIMRNERYCGDILARKTYTPNCFNHKSRKNNRKRNQYRMSGHHEAIVTPEQWRAAQKILDSRKYRFEGGYLPVSVIKTGALRGFVPINRAWSGNSLEDYFIVSRDAYGEFLPEYLKEYDETASEADEEYGGGNIIQNTDTFQVADRNLFSRAGEPMLYITAMSVRFSNSCASKLACGMFIEILLNPIERLLAVRPCEETNPNALQWVNDKYKPRLLGTTGFSKMIFSLMSWNENCRYSLPAMFRRKNGENIMFFDLDDPIVKPGRFSKDTEQYEESESDSAYFGVPFAIHKTESRVPMIDFNNEWNISESAVIAEETENFSPDVSSVINEITRN